MTCGSSMLAMIPKCPPQRAQLSISMPNTRFRRRAQFIAAVRVKHAVIPRQVHGVVADGVVEQMGDAEIESTTAGEYVAPHPIRERVRIGRGPHVRLRERDAHLHRPTGPHGIQIGEELAAERHRANEVLEHFAQGPFGSCQPLSFSRRYSPSRRSRPVSLIRWLTLMTWTLLRPAFLAA